MTKCLVLGLVAVTLSSFGEVATSQAELVAEGITLKNGLVKDCERRDFSDGYAIRYKLPADARRVVSESTHWTLPLDAKVWYQKSLPNGILDYEAPYSTSLVKEIAEGQIIALPITAKLSDGTYRLITEANTVDFTDLAVIYRGKGRFDAYYYADRNGFDRDATEATSPWRVMLVANDLQTLATSDIVRRLCPEAPAERVQRVQKEFAKPGRSIWHWLPMGAPRYEEQRQWFDKTKELGYEYYLIDEGWRNWGDDITRWQKLKDCIDYGKSIGVQSFIWVNSKEMRQAEARRAYLKKAKEVGAVGIKIDFIPTPSARVMKWYEETLRETYELGLVVDFHGCVKPSGRERTWPHEYAREAIRGHEWHITRYRRILPFDHDTILPFNRLVQGHGDYTPVVFEKSQLIHFTWGRQLAQGIVFAAKFLCLGDYPANYLNNPAREVIANYACEYDETLILPGSEIGECIAVARRKGNEWVVAIENGGAPRKIELDFSFLKKPAHAKFFADVPDRLDAYAISEATVAPDDKKVIEIRPGGGFVAVLK